jgi:Pentapeptide repeats (8 copies)
MKFNNVLTEELDDARKDQNLDLRNANLRHAALSGADLRNANLFGTDLSNADLSHANLFGADLRSADLLGADLSNSNLSRANLSHADLSNSNLSRANLRHANLSNSNLSHTNLFGADLSNVDLSTARIVFVAAGNNKEVRTLQLYPYIVVITSTRLAIGCKTYSIEDWMNFDDSTIDAMDYGALLWSRKHKPILKAILDL